MTQYIDKSALVAEMKGLIRANELYLSESETDEIRFQKAGAYSILNDLLHFLDTLEVKEVGYIDTFIEKACEWIKENLLKHTYVYEGEAGIGMAVFLEEFKQAMEGE